MMVRKKNPVGLSHGVTQVRLGSGNTPAIARTVKGHDVVLCSLTAHILEALLLTKRLVLEKFPGVLMPNAHRSAFASSYFWMKPWLVECLLMLLVLILCSTCTRVTW